jgi:RNA polymerase sigma-70 factor (ECF subfamily)
MARRPIAPACATRVTSRGDADAASDARVSARGIRRYLDVHHLPCSRVYVDVTIETRRRDAAPRTDWKDVRARLRSFVAGHVPDEPSIHDDIVQEILLRLHRGLPRLRNRERLDAFAYQVARNAITDHYRKRRREQPVHPETLQAHCLVEHDEPDDASRTSRAQLAGCLRPLIERLDDDYRHALLLTDLGDLSQAEAARRLGLSAPGMRSRVQRGRAQLRAALARCCRVERDAAARIHHVEQVGPCACSPTPAQSPGSQPSTAPSRHDGGSDAGCC